MTSLVQRWWGRLSRISIRQIDLIIAVVVTLTALLLFDFAGLLGSPIAGFLFLQNIELRSLDMRFAVRGQRPQDPRIVIVGIDEQTLQKIRAFPLPRSSYVTLVNQLSAGGARVIAFDATFPTPESQPTLEALGKLQREVEHSASPAVLNHIKKVAAESDEDSMFAASLKQSGNVVLGHLFLARAGDPKLAEEYFNIAWAKSFPQVFPVNSKDGQKFDLGEVWAEKGGVVAHGVEANIAKLAEAAASYGFIDINPDSDGTLRHALLMIRYQDQDYFPSLALQVLREYEKIPDQDIAAYIASDGLERIKFGRHVLWPSPDATALINYTGPYGTYPHYSMWDVMTGAVPPETFKDKIVLVGATAKAIGDIRNTPFQKRDSVYMGVEVHANIIDNLLHSDEKGRGFLVRSF
jgi:CHASE2 domain-containing sensor protein